MTLLVLLVIFAGGYVLVPVSATVIVRDNTKSNLFLNVSNFEFWTCAENFSYPVLVSNVNIYLTNESHVEMSGTMQSQVDLDQDIEADIVLKRYIWEFWAPVPCEHNIGSCTYKDLCAFGVPSDKNCPKDFIEQNVPCRCPISKGTYTLRMQVKPLLIAVSSIYTGSYKGSITVKHKESLLSCYNFSFNLIDETEQQLPSVVLIH